MADDASAQRMVRVKGGKRRPEGPVPKLRTPFEEIPPEETDPRQRVEPTIGLIDLTPDGHAALGTSPPPLDVPGVDPLAEVRDRSDDVLRTFDDIMAAFPIGMNDQYYVYVERKQPVMFDGVACKGVQRRLRDRVTIEQFKQIYGGGVYFLTVYGPPKRGGMPDPVTGAVVPKALSKPISLTIPWHLNGGIPPNRDSAYDQDPSEDEDFMTTNGNGDGIAGLPRTMFRNGPNPAAAQVVAHKYRHDEVMDERRAQRRAERMHARAQRDHTALSAVERLAEQRAADLQRELESAREELREARRGGSSSVPLEIIDRMNPRAGASEIAELRDANRREMESLTRAHKQEIETLHRMNREDHDRLVEQNRSALERAEERVRIQVQRSDDRVREVEAQMDRERGNAKTDIERVEQRMRADHDRMIQHLTAEHARQTDALKQHYEQLLDAERRQATRDDETRKQISQSQLETSNKSFEIELRSKERELKSVREQLEEAKRVAERGKNLSQLLEEAKKQASLLGYVPAEEATEEERDDSWAGMFKTIIMEGMKNMPQILQSAGQAVAQVRSGTAAGQARAQQQPGLPPGMSAPRQFASQQMQQPTTQFVPEGAGIRPPDTGPDFYPVRRSVAAPPPPPVPAPMPEVPAVAVAQAPVAAGATPEMPPFAQNVAPASMPPTAAPASAATAGALPAGAPPAPAAPAMTPEMQQALDQAILQSLPTLEGAFANGTEPQAICDYILQAYSKEQIRSQLAQFAPDNVIAAIARSGQSSRLSSRAGKKFLKAIDGKIRQALG